MHNKLSLPHHFAGRYFTHSFFDCVPSEIERQVRISPAECEQVRDNGVYSSSELRIENIDINKPVTHFWYSYGKRDESANCMVTDFSRNGVIYKNSYEKSTAKFSITAHTRKTEPGLVTGGEEILLGHGIRMPAAKKNHEDPRFGTMVWRYEAPSCSAVNNLRQYQEIYRGDADIRVRQDATALNKYEGSILTVHPIDQHGVLPKTFGLALHHTTSVCGRPALQSNIEDVQVIILDKKSSEPIPINYNIALSQPHLTAFKTVASRWFVEANNRVDDLSQTFYEETCALERQSIMNFQRILRLATSSTSLAPFFGEGYTALKTGGVARVVHCTPESAEINLQMEGCWDELPVYRSDHEGKPINETWWADPVTRVLSPVGTRVDCSPRYPQMYRLDGGTYVCQAGNGFTKCAEPTILAPGTSDLHDVLTTNFHKLMGTGIYTDKERRAMAFRFFENKYEDHLKTEQAWKNKGKVEKGLPMSPIITAETEEGIFKRFAMRFNPVFHFIGEWWGYAIGLLCVTALIAGLCGCARRMCWEINVVGCTPMIILTACNGLWTVARMPYHMWRGAATAPATVAQKGTPFSFEDVELTGRGLSEELTRSPPPPYSSKMKNWFNRRWRQWKSVPTAEFDTQLEPETPAATAPEATHSPNTILLNNSMHHRQSSAPESTSDIIETQPSGFQRFIKGGSHVHYEDEDRCPYPDVARARSSRATDSTCRSQTLPATNIVRQEAYYQQRRPTDQQPFTREQLDALVKDSNDSLGRSLSSVHPQPALRKPQSLSLTEAKITNYGPTNGAATSPKVPSFIEDATAALE